MSTNSRYNLRSKYFTTLPWNSVLDLPDKSKSWYENYLKNYKPTICDKKSFISQLKILFYINSIAPVEAVIKIFKLIAENKWYVKNHPKFHKIVRDKIFEFIDFNGHECYKEEFGDTLDFILNGSKRVREY